MLRLILMKRSPLMQSIRPSIGEMSMEVTLEAENGGTIVSLLFKGIPSGVRPEDNEAGTQSSLEKLAHYIEEGIG